MATRREMLLAVRAVRNALFARDTRRVSARIKLTNRCDLINDASLEGAQAWDGDMPDPLHPSNRGHCVLVVPSGGTTGAVLSLTGPRKILGTIDDMTTPDHAAKGLRDVAGGHEWTYRPYRRGRRP